MNNLKSNFIKELKTHLKENKIKDYQQIINEVASKFDELLNEGKSEMECIMQLGEPKKIAEKYIAVANTIKPEPQEIKEKTNKKSKADKKEKLKVVDDITGDATVEETIIKKHKKPKKRYFSRLFAFILLLAVGMLVPIVLINIFTHYMAGTLSQNKIIINSSIALLSTILFFIIRKVIKNLHVKNFYNTNC